MKERVSKFLRILKIELEDLEEDINTLAELTEERRRQHAISEYVSLENISLLKQEFAGLKEVVDTLGRVERIGDESFDDFIQRLKKQIREVIIASAYPNAVYIFVDRKIDKVVDYLEEHIR